MKKLLFFLLFPLLALSQTVITVTPGQNIASLVQAQKAGTVIKFAAGTYDVQNFNVPVGVSLEGVYDNTSKVPLTILRFSGFEWWKGCLQLRSENLTKGDQYIRFLTLDGQGAKGFTGIQVFGRTDIEIGFVHVTGFYHSGIELAGSPSKPCANIRIHDFRIENSSRETANASIGNLLLSGYLKNISIGNGTIVHTSNINWGSYGEKSSGYALKFQPYYEGSTNAGGKLSDCEIFNVTDIGKDFAKWGNNVPNISFEFLQPVEHLQIHDCVFSTHLSLEHNYAATTWTARVYRNKFKVVTGQSIELDLSQAVIEDNDFDYSENANAWNWIGNYNGSETHKEPIVNTTITGNRIILGNRGPILYVSTVPLKNFTVSNNTFTGTGKPLLLELRRSFSNGSVGVNYTGNRFPNGYTEIGFSEGSNSAKPANFVVSATSVNPPVVSPPITTPPVVSPPVTNPPPAKVDTVYVPKEIIKEMPVYYETTILKRDSVYVDLSSGTIQFKLKTTTTSNTVKK